MAERDALYAAARLMEQEMEAGGEQALWLAHRAAIIEMAEERRAHIETLSHRTEVQRSFHPATPEAMNDIV